MKHKFILDVSWEEDGEKEIFPINLGEERWAGEMMGWRVTRPRTGFNGRGDI